MTAKKEIKSPSNIDELRKFGCNALADIANEKINLKAAHEISNLIGKVNHSVMVEIAHAKLNKEKADIPFLQYSK